jgi:protein phosphatase
MIKAVNVACSKIYEKSLEDPILRGMGTTATMVKIIGKKGFIAHVGDSRLYLIRSGFIYRMTFDHSLVNEQVRAGVITEEEASLHKLRNIITRSVGYQEEEDVDTFVFDLEDGDYLILCSDGLHGKIDEYELTQICLKKSISAVSTLIDLANQRGGEDNITAVILRVKV